MLSGVILAGGHHRWMLGENRAFLQMEGQTLLERQIAEMRAYCSEITIVTNDPKPFLRSVERDIRIITDYYRMTSMLSGMHAGLSLAQNDYVWVIGCHLPFPSAAAAMLLLARMDEGVEAAIPRIGDSVFPLHGIYTRSCADRIGEQLRSGNAHTGTFLDSLRRVEVNALEFREHGIDTRFVQTIRTMEDYRKLACPSSMLWAEAGGADFYLQQHVK